eukprot:403368188
MQYEERKAQEKNLRKELNLESESEESDDSSDIEQYDELASLNRSNTSAYQLFHEKVKDHSQYDNHERYYLPPSSSFLGVIEQKPIRDGTGGSEELENQPPSIYKSRFCSTCYIFRPPLASHCRFCDQCVTHFDHHCYLTNNCIGKRNVKYFVLFINLTLISSVIFIFTYISLLLPEQVPKILDQQHFQDNLNTLILYSYLVLIILTIIEMFIQKLRAISLIVGMLYIGVHLYQLKIDQNLKELPYAILYVIQCFVFGSSLHFSLTYLYLNYLGFTMKELIAVREHTGRRALCINPCYGLRNLLAFYLDFEYVQSQFQKEYTKPERQNIHNTSGNSGGDINNNIFDFTVTNVS